jgi:hypothetical protein
MKKGAHLFHLPGIRASASVLASRPALREKECPSPARIHMSKLRPLYFLSAALVSVSLLAQQDVPPPPPTPAEPPADPTPASTPKVNLPPARTTTDETGTPAPRPKPKATPMPVATPLPAATPKPSFWERLFGRRKKPTPKPTPAKVEKSTPAPKKVEEKPAPKKSTPKPAAKPDRNVDSDLEKPKATPKPRATPAPEPDKPKATPKPRATPEPEVERPKATPASKTTPAPKPPPPAVTAPKATPVPDPGPGADPETVERHKFTEAKRKALDDAKVQELKLKADSAANEDEARKALREYNKALFREMRKIDPSIKERIDATEAAILRRLGE